MRLKPQFKICNLKTLFLVLRNGVLQLYQPFIVFRLHFAEDPALKNCRLLQ